MTAGSACATFVTCCIPSGPASTPGVGTPCRSAATPAPGLVFSGRGASPGHGRQQSGLEHGAGRIHPTDDSGAAALAGAGRHQPGIRQTGRLPPAWFGRFIFRPGGHCAVNRDGEWQGGNGRSPPAAADAVTIQDDLITVLPTAVSAQTHNYLDNLAKLEEALPNRFIYRLSGAAVHQNFENGKTLAQLLKGWQEYLPLPMPAAMQQQLSAWWEAYGQVRLYEKVTVIEFGDEYALAEMKAATSLEKYLVAEISPGLIIIPAEAVDSLVAELEKAGYTPNKQTRWNRF
ncbi:MAG: helicase-associated domain-containing protein [Chloroflexi bacterium]|nr:helicase-associated domain-containing protein [Chloroflexota bacterium]